MELSTLSLFWRDEVACCFTSMRFFDVINPLIRARQIAEVLQPLSTLQLYGIIANEQILPWQPINSPPQTGTEYRIEFSLYPSEPINPSAGINIIKFSIPGPNPELASLFTPPINFSHSLFKLLSQEIFPYLRLPNGLPVNPIVGAQIKKAVLIEIAQQYRPQAGRPPVDAAISGTVKQLDEARSRLARAQRANQPIEIELMRVEKIQRQLAHLKVLHELEQLLWQNLTPAEETPPWEAVMTLPPSPDLSLIVDKTRFLPITPLHLDEWRDLATKDFLNPDLWEQIGQLKDKFKITSERSFWRTLAHLRELGLRILPAQQNKRIRLFYRPDAERLLAKLAHPAETITAQVPSQIDKIWQAITDLQTQQQVILQALTELQNQQTLPQKTKKPLKL